MLSYIDPILFPDECRVLEVAPDQYVYNIFKNGSSSLNNSGFRPLHIQEVILLDHVDIYVREPFDRYVSGVQTYLAKLGPGYDRDTVLKMVHEFLFLNRHFALQFHWLVNLRRHCNPLITIKPLLELTHLIKMNFNESVRDQQLVDYFESHDRLWFYLQLDKVLTEDLLGQTLRFSDIIKFIQARYPALHQEVISRSREICTVLG